MLAVLLFVVMICWYFFFTPGAEKAIMSHIDQLYERSSNVQKILLIATGGTIASTKTAQGLAPGITSQELYRERAGSGRVLHHRHGAAVEHRQHQRAA